MKTNSTICFRSSRRAGLTLIEVVAAIAILGTILVGVVVAKSRHTRQLSLSQRTHAAVRAADELIATWWTSPRGVPIGEEGIAPTDTSFLWSTRAVDNRDLQKLGARVVRVELREASPTDSRPVSTGDILVAVELVLPEPALEPASADGAVEEKTHQKRAGDVKAVEKAERGGKAGRQP